MRILNLLRTLLLLLLLLLLMVPHPTTTTTAPIRRGRHQLNNPILRLRRRPILHPSHKLAPARTVIRPEELKLLAELPRRLAPHRAVAAYRALDVPAAEDALERRALRHARARGRRRDEQVHRVEPLRELADRVVVRPPLEWRVRVVRYRRSRRRWRKEVIR